MGIPDDRGFGTHPGIPTFEVAAVLVDEGRHHGPHREGFLPTGVGLVFEDLPHGTEVASAARALARSLAQRAAVGVLRRVEARGALPRCDVAVAVVLVEDPVGVGKVVGVVLRLAVRPHDALEAADGHLVLGGDRARRFQGRAPRQHHRSAGGHDQHAAGVHQHRGQRVPVALGADVHALHDQVHDPVVLGELDDALHHPGGRIEVLGAAVHGDLRARGDRDPLEGHPHRLGQVEGSDDSIALRCSQRAHPDGRIGKDQHPLQALGVFVRRCGHDAEDDGTLVLAVGASGNVPRDGTRALAAR